jgi:putative hydrolase of the HAD superfamily
MIKAVIFDLWETLVEDKGKGEVERDIARADFIMQTLNLPRELKLNILDFFTALSDAFRNPLPGNEWSLVPEAQIDYLIRSLDLKVNKEEFEKIFKFYTESILDKPPTFTEECIPTVLASLKDKYKLAMVSNTGRSPGKTLLKMLDEKKIRKYFDVFSFSDELLMRKPDSRIFEITVSKLHVQPNEAVHVGDSYKMDFLGAQSAGVNPILYAKDVESPKVTPFIKSHLEAEKTIRDCYDRN